MCGRCSVRGLRCAGIALFETCIIIELHCMGVTLCETCTVECGSLEVWEVCESWCVGGPLSGGLRCVEGYSVWGFWCVRDFSVEELQSEGVTAWGSCCVGKLRCGGV